ncbi:MAG TPA: hypothetical protein VMN81_04695 [Vicinamibacterales bacterium]|nr:hypothetical protein [Vicinamibacterales bacterium]
MTTRPLLAALLVSSAVALPGAGQALQQPVFRSALDVVTIDVAVRSGGTPVGGLTAKDFVLLDNGVPQTIESVEMEAVPIDVSILVDANVDVDLSVASMNRQVPAIAALLRQGDRLRVTSISGHVSDALRLQPAGGPLASAPALEADGMSAAYDGLAAALLRPVDSSRRHIIVAITNGIDAASTLAVQAVAGIARRSPAVLHIVQVDIARRPLLPSDTLPDLLWESGRDRRGETAQCRMRGLCGPARSPWRPYDQKEFDVLREAAEATGGALHVPGLFNSASSIFRKVFEDYRRSYLLRYTPEGVPREGWHDVVVTVPAYPSYTVHARRGYGVEAAGPDGGTPGASGAFFSGVPAGTPLHAVIDAYGRADYRRLEQELAGISDGAALVTAFREAGNLWPANPKREAVLVVEIADAAMATRRIQARDAARDLLRSYRMLVRHPLWPDDFERYWLWGVIASLQGVILPDLTREFADYALTRFPNEPRFLLAQAFAVDQTRAFAETSGRNGAGQASHVRDVTARYDAAARFPETAAEARVRKAFFLHRIGRHAEALAELEGADGRTADRDVTIGYLRRLIRGRVLEGLGRFGEARAAYESARSVLPDAQSPAVALMRLHVRSGDRPAADALAAAIETAPKHAFDPWWVYWLGDARQYGAIVARLREETR